MMIFRKISPVLYGLVFILVLAVPALSDNPKMPFLSLDKSLSPPSIPSNGTTAVTITVKNYGGADAMNVIIDDPVPDQFVSDNGQNPVTFKAIPSTLKLGESKIFTYKMTLKANTQLGDIKSTDATVHFQDLEGNSYNVTSTTQPQYINVKQSPGFEVVLAGIGILIALVLRRR